jgi:hypothetical protein
LTPRLDQREHHLPEAQIHCNIFVSFCKEAGGLVVRDTAFSRAVNGSSFPTILSLVIAAPLVGSRHVAGIAGGPSNATGPRNPGRSVAVSRTDAIDKGVENGKPRPRGRHQLTCRKPARAS